MPEYKIYYRVTIEGNFDDFPSLEKALEYIKNKWNEDTSYASIRLIKHKIEKKGK